MAYNVGYDCPSSLTKAFVKYFGISPIEFAYEVFKQLDLKSSEELEKWFQLFKNGVFE